MGITIKYEASSLNEIAEHLRGVSKEISRRAELHPSSASQNMRGEAFGLMKAAELLDSTTLVANAPPAEYDLDAPSIKKLDKLYQNALNTEKANKEHMGRISSEAASAWLALDYYRRQLGLIE